MAIVARRARQAKACLGRLRHDATLDQGDVVQGPVQLAVAVPGSGGAGWSVRKVDVVARDLLVSDQTIYNWRKQDLIDRGERPGMRSAELAELQAARRRIAELEAELAATKRTNELLKEAVPKRPVRGIVALSEARTRRALKGAFTLVRGVSAGLALARSALAGIKWNTIRVWTMGRGMA
jgi:transposase